MFGGFKNLGLQTLRKQGRETHVYVKVEAIVTRMAHDLALSLPNQELEPISARELFEVMENAVADLKTEKNLTLEKISLALFNASPASHRQEVLDEIERERKLRRQQRQDESMKATNAVRAPLRQPLRPTSIKIQVPARTSEPVPEPTLDEILKEYGIEEESSLDNEQDSATA
jgi:hypothetical protein